MPALAQGSGAAAGSRLLSRLAVLFARQMAAAGLERRGSGGLKAPIEEASLATSRPRPRPPQRRLAVAFSGGPDSAALGMLAAWWAGTAMPPFAAVEEALRAEREGVVLAPPPPPPLPLSLALERWWRRESCRKGAHSLLPVRSFAASCVEIEDEEDDTEGDEQESEREGEQEQEQEQPPLAPLALVVDHGLRPGSRRTALRAASLAASLGLEPMVLEASWPLEKEQEGKQEKKRTTLEAARDARFASLLSAIAAARSLSKPSPPIPALLLGHHADDQAETVALRLLRASGPAGLSGIPARSWLQLPMTTTTATATKAAATTSAKTAPPLLCLRPLLSVPKSTLLKALDAAGVRGWVRDPANGDLGPPRNRLRGLLAGAAAEEAARGRRGTAEEGGDAAPLSTLALLTKVQEHEARRSAAAATRLASALRARRERVERGAAAALEASGLEALLSSFEGEGSGGTLSCPPSSSPSSPQFLLKLAPLVSVGESVGKAALAAVLDAAAAAAAEAATTSHSSSPPPPLPPSSEAAAARLWGSVLHNGGRLSGAFTGARCVVRPVPGSKGAEIIVRSSVADERERRKGREKET